MDIRHLRTFVTVADLGTVSRASLRLGIAQPALSRQIKDLERDLGVRLFDRIRRRLMLTSEGHVLLNDCRTIMNSIGSLKDHAQLLKRPDAGLLRVAATPQTIDGVLSVFLSRYSQSRPNVQVKLSEAFGSELLALVARGEVHIAISTVGAIEASGYSFENIWLPSLEFVAACHPATDLGGAETLDIRKLGTRPLLLLNASFAVRAAFDAACRVAEFQPNVAFESRTPHTLLALAEAGHGIAIVPSVLPTRRYDLRVIRLTYRSKPLRERYAIVFDKQRSLPPAADEFCRAVADHVREVFPISRPSNPKGQQASARKKSTAKR